MFRESWVGRGRARALVVGLTCAGAGLVATPAAQALQPVGIVTTTTLNCAGGVQVVNKDAVIPVDGKVVQFRYRARAGSAQADLQVLRPTGNPDQYRLVARRTVTNPGGTGIATVNPGTPITVRAGDVLGTYALDTGFPCTGNDGNGSDTEFVFVSRPNVGDVRTVTTNAAGDLNLRAIVDEKPTATVDGFSGNSPNPDPFGGGLTAGVLSGTASDDVDVSSVQVNIRNPAGGFNQTFFATCPGGCNGTSETWTLNLSGLGIPKNRDLTARARAIDSVGNVGAYSAPFAFHSNP